MVTTSDEDESEGEDMVKEEQQARVSQTPKGRGEGDKPAIKREESSSGVELPSSVESESKQKEQTYELREVLVALALSSEGVLEMNILGGESVMVEGDSESARKERRPTQPMRDRRR